MVTPLVVDEAVSFRPTAVFVIDDPSALDRAELFKEGLELQLGHLWGNVVDDQLLGAIIFAAERSWRSGPSPSRGGAKGKVVRWVVRGCAGLH